MEKIVVVGENGMVGSHFVEQFKDKYQMVRFNRTNSSEPVLPENFSTLLFLAQSSDYKSRNFTPDLLSTNITLLYDFLNASIGKTKKVIYFSTGSVYKNSSDILYEDTILNYNSGNPYISSKIMAEELIGTFQHFFDEIIIVRPFFIYGRGQNENMLFPSLINNIKTGSPITLNEGKGLIFNPIQAGDAASFIEFILTREFKGLHILNLFGPETMSLGEVVKLFEKSLGMKANLIVKSESPMIYLAGSNRHDFIPEISVDKGILKMIDSD